MKSHLNMVTNFRSGTLIMVTKINNIFHLELVQTQKDVGMKHRLFMAEWDITIPPTRPRWEASGKAL